MTCAFGCGLLVVGVAEPAEAAERHAQVGQRLAAAWADADMSFEPRRLGGRKLAVEVVGEGGAHLLAFARVRSHQAGKNSFHRVSLQSRARRLVWKKEIPEVFDPDQTAEIHLASGRAEAAF